MLSDILIIILVAALTFIFVKFICQKRKERAVLSAHSKYIEHIENIRTHLLKRIKALEDTVESLSYSNNELTQTDKTKSKFMSMVAHDLRQPLTSIQGYASLLESSVQNPEDKQILTNILNASDNMNHLMRDLSDAAMLKSGNIKLEPSKFVINDLIDQIYNQYAIIAQKRKVVFRKVDYPIEITVTADRFRISQVLSNLINNALKFTPEKGVVELRLLKEENHIVIFVSDSGAGLVHLERVKIFEKFQQSEALAEELRKLGWGLGLSIARDIIEAHNGVIDADSAGLGKGSVFWFAIPIEFKAVIRVSHK